jgi:hypothetical protein
VSETLLVAESHGCESTQLHARVQRYPHSARVRRAGWHFAGVPGFLVASFVLARRRLLQELEFESVSGPCPSCRADQEHPVPGAASFPLVLPCPGCGEFLKLSQLR